MNNPPAANRVATTIATFKWIAVGGLALIAVIAFIGGMASGDASGAAVGFFFLIGGGFYCLITWVLFGWFEQTLRMLATIAENTAPGSPPPSYPPPSPPGYGSTP